MSTQWDWLCRCVLARLSASPAYFRPPLVLVGPTFSWLLIPPLRITKKGYLSVTFFYYWSGQWDWRCRCVLARLSASPAYFRPPLVLVGPTFSWLLIPPLRITKKGYLSVTFFYYWSGQWDSDPRHQPWQPKKSTQRWLLLAFYHVNFTDIGMFSHIVDIINFGIGFSIF